MGRTSRRHTRPRRLLEEQQSGSVRRLRRGCCHPVEAGAVARLAVVVEAQRQVAAVHIPMLSQRKEKRNNVSR